MQRGNLVETLDALLGEEPGGRSDHAAWRVAAARH